MAISDDLPVTLSLPLSWGVLQCGRMLSDVGMNPLFHAGLEQLKYEVDTLDVSQCRREEKMGVVRGSVVAVRIC